MKELIERAREELKGKIRHTPVEHSPGLSKLLGSPTYLKLEYWQTTGSFKLRGAFFTLSTLSPEERVKGVAACSSGNHGLGMAYAARQMNIPCVVYVPKSVDQSKYDKLVQMGVQVEKSPFMGYDDTLVWAKERASEAGIPLISAFNDERIIAANGGTLAAEVLEQMPEATHFVVPMGGGGLAAGFSWQVKAERPKAKMTLCQLYESPALKLSLEQGKAVTYMPPVDTLAGGLEGGLGEKCFEILKSRVDEVVLIKEEELKSAILWMLEHHQCLIEPSSAVPLAACLFGHVKTDGTTVIVLSGRNVSYATIRGLFMLSHLASSTNDF